MSDILITRHAVAAEIKARITIFDLGRKFYPGWMPSKSCHSPFREDRSPSFSVYGNGTRFKDFATDDGGDVFDFYRLATGCDKRQSFKDLKDMAGGSGPDVTPIAKSPKPQIPETREQHHPALEKPQIDDLLDISNLRSISVEALKIAAKRRLLYVGKLKRHRAWVITDRTEKNYLARRFDAGLWEHIGEKKAYTLPGSQANWPIGIEESEPYPAIALCEGAPDFLSAFAHAWASSVEDQVAPVCMAGASGKIPDDALDSFKGKRVRIFVHDDEAGYRAAKRWAIQLSGVASKIDGYRFDGLKQASGEPVKDLNDLLRVDYDCWEANRATIESVMDFAKEGRN